MIDNTFRNIEINETNKKTLVVKISETKLDDFYH